MYGLGNLLLYRYRTVHKFVAPEISTSRSVVWGKGEKRRRVVDELKRGIASGKAVSEKVE